MCGFESHPGQPLFQSHRLCAFHLLFLLYTNVSFSLLLPFFFLLLPFPNFIPPLPPSLPSDFFCYCTTCPDSYILCGSHFGCATLYGYDISVSTGGPSIVTSHFCLSRDDFVSCGQTPGVVCCLSNFCNAPHSLNLTEALPTGSPTEPIMAEITYPIEIPSVTEGSPTNQNTGIYIYTLATGSINCETLN